MKEFKVHELQFYQNGMELWIDAMKTLDSAGWEVISVSVSREPGLLFPKLLTFLQREVFSGSS